MPTEKGISIKITDNITKKLSELLAGIEKPEKVLRAIGKLEKDQTQLRFSKGQSPSGKIWKKLAIRKGQPLLDTGRLRNSISFVVGGRSLFVGTNVSYGKTHQLGATIKPKNKTFLAFKPRGSGSFIFTKKPVTIPARPFLGVNKRTNQNIINVMKKFLDGKI